MVSRCGPPIWARRQQAAYLNKDCEHSESPKVRRRLPSPGEQRSECTADLNSCVRGREAAERGGPRGPREATSPALSRGAVASLPGLERRASDVRTCGILHWGAGHVPVRHPDPRPSLLSTSSHASHSPDIFSKYRILQLHSSGAPGSPSAPVDTRLPSCTGRWRACPPLGGGHRAAGTGQQPSLEEDRETAAAWSRIPSSSVPSPTRGHSRGPDPQRLRRRLHLDVESLRR